MILSCIHSVGFFMKSADKLFQNHKEPSVEYEK